MEMEDSLHVAVLLATYNGARYIEEQIRSLKDNSTPFVLHWLDDHSSDDTRERVTASARSVGIELREWHPARHIGLPGSFFALLEQVEADIYFFCDQDDIWQPGKIDAAVEDLLPDIESPTLCCSDSLEFVEGQSKEPRRMSERTGFAAASEAVRSGRLLFTGIFGGHAQAFTRPLRQIFLRCPDVAREYACMHDAWMHHLALMCGELRVLRDKPAALYRLHEGSFSHTYLGVRGIGMRRDIRMWTILREARTALARHSRGLCVASMSLPLDARATGILALARTASRLDRVHSLLDLVQLMRSGVFRITATHWVIWLAISMLFTTGAPVGWSGASLDATRSRSD